MITVGVIFVVHFKYELFLYVLIARVLIYKKLGPGDHSNIARVRHILHGHSTKHGLDSWTGQLDWNSFLLNTCNSMFLKKTK